MYIYTYGVWHPLQLITLVSPITHSHPLACRLLCRQPVKQSIRWQERQVQLLCSSLVSVLACTVKCPPLPGCLCFSLSLCNVQSWQAGVGMRKRFLICDCGMMCSWHLRMCLQTRYLWTPLATNLKCFLWVFFNGSLGCHGGACISFQLRPGSRILAPGPWIPYPRSRVWVARSRIRILDPGCWIQDTGSRT